MRQPAPAVFPLFRSRLTTAVLADKQVAAQRPVAADFAAVLIPDRYAFGCGMDVSGAWRNLPAIYALRETA